LQFLHEKAIQGGLPCDNLVLSGGIGTMHFLTIADLKRATIIESRKVGHVLQSVAAFM